MKVYLGTDHSGFGLKEEIKNHLQAKGYDVEDCGAYKIDPKDDYPDSSSAAAKKVSENPQDLAIVIGGSGQGEAMTANKFKGVRAALFYGPQLPKRAVDVSGRESKDPYEILRLSRQHNHANVLSLAARFLTNEEAITAVDIWLNEPFSQDERHVRRVEKIAAIENKLS